jgi:hypothetical protein
LETPRIRWRWVRGCRFAGDATPLSHSVQRTWKTGEEIRLKKQFFDPLVRRCSRGSLQLDPNVFFGTCRENRRESDQDASRVVKV